MVSTDTLEQNKMFAEQEQADFPILADPKMTVADAYGVLPPKNPDAPNVHRTAQRWMFFIGPDGKLLWVEAKGHTTDAGTFLATKLEELGVKKR